MRNILKVERSGVLLVAEPLFDVEYDVEPTPSFQRELDEYHAKTGMYPPAYRKVQEVYRMAQSQVREIMPKVEMFRPYFALLDVTVMAATVVTSLLAAGACPVPQLPSAAVEKIRHLLTPKLYPPIPVCLLPANLLVHAWMEFIHK